MAGVEPVPPGTSPAPLPEGEPTQPETGLVTGEACPVGQQFPVGGGQLRPALPVGRQAQVEPGLLTPVAFGQALSEAAVIGQGPVGVPVALLHPGQVPEGGLGKGTGRVGLVAF